MKNLFTLLLLMFLQFSNIPVYSVAVAPPDTVLTSKFTLSSRNAVAQLGKYKRVNVNVEFDDHQRTYYLNINSDKELNAFLEVSDQDENVIFFKQVEIKAGKNRLPLVTEDGPQSLFRLTFSETASEKQAIFIIRAFEDVASTISPELTTIR